MPRPVSGTNEKQRQYTADYRARLAAKREPETDAVDAALASALASFIAPSLRGGPEARSAAGKIIRRAVKHLTAKGYSADAAGRRLSARLYCLQMDQAYPHASPADRYRWTVGEQAVPDPITYEMDIDPLEIDAGPHDYDYDHGDYDDEAA